MNLWFLTSEFPPYFGGGIATYMGLTADLFARHGHAVTVFLHDPASPGTRIESRPNGVRVIRFHEELSPDYKPLANFARVSYLYANAVARQIRIEGPPDVIESQEYHALPYQLLHRKRTLDPMVKDVPVVITAHSPKFLLDPLEEAPPYLLPDWWVGEMERLSLRTADQVIAPSAYLRAALRDALPGLDPQVIPNPFPVPSDVPPPGGGLVYIGRLQVLKGVLVLFAALQRLWDQGWSQPIDCYGGDAMYKVRNQSMREFLQERYRPYVERGLIRFHGLVPPDQVAHVLRAAGVVAVPSLFENFPYAVVEAMAHGRVVVASDTGGQRDLIVDGYNGFLFPGRDVAALAAVLEHAVSLSPAQKAAVGQAARHAIADVAHPDQVYAEKIRVYDAVRQTPRVFRSFPFIRPVPALPPLAPGRRELSVVIPYHNLGPYVKDTLTSLRGVQDVDMEILLVDDGSTDLLSIRRLYQIYDEFPEVAIVRTENQGLARTRNFGAARAQGTYLAFLDADDTVHPQYYPRALQILRAYDNVSFVGAWTKYRGESDEIWMTWNPEPPYILFRNAVNSSALVYRRQDFLEYGLNDPDFIYGYEDYESVVRLVRHGRVGVVIPEPLFFYLARPNSMSHAFTPEGELFLHSLMVRKNAEIYRQYGAELTQIINANWPHYTNDNPSSPF